MQGKDGSVLLLTPTNSLNANVAAKLSANKASIHEVRFLGGPPAISQAVRNQVKALFPLLDQVTSGIDALLVDNVAPVVTVTGVANGGLYKAPATPVITITGAASQTITLDGAPFISGTLVSAQGAHALVAAATDAAGNTTTVTVTFTIDTTAPVVTVTGVAGGGLYKAPVTPVVTVTGATAQTITLNGSPYVSGTPVTAEGAYTLVATASDAAGNTTTVTVAFTIDLTAPEIAVTGVAGGGLYKAPVTPVVTVTGATAQTITLNGSPYVSGTPVTAEGAYTLVATASDAAGNTTTVTVAFAIDLTAPAITVTGATADGVDMAGSLAGGFTLPTTNVSSIDHLLQLKAGSVTSEPLAGAYTGLYLAPAAGQTAALQAYYAARGVPSVPLDFLGFLNDAAAGTKPFVYLKAAGTTLTLVDAAKHDLLGTDPAMTVPDDFPLGTYTVSGTVADAAGNTTVVTFKLIVSGDRVAPEIAVTGVAGGGLYKAPVTPVVTVTGATAQTITLNGSPYVSGTPVTAEGAYTLVATASDAAGNTTTVTVAFTIDLTAPEIAVTGVAGGGLYKAPVTPVVTISGETAKTITLNGSPYVSGTPVTAEGAYTLVATASDAAGNTTTVTVAFAIDLTAPAITVTGATADGVDMAGSLAGGFTLPTTNVSSIDHLLQLKAGSVTSEPLAGAYTGLYLAPAAGQTAALQAYYAARGVPSVPLDFLGFLNDAAAGTKPFVYLKAAGTTLTLVDAAKHDLLGTDPAMTVPDDFPLGTYTVSGTVADAAGNTTVVTFKLIVSGDRVAPEIAVTGVAGGGLYKAPVTPVVTVTGATAQTITLNGSPYVSGTPVTAEGAYTLVATASDAAGNTTTVTVAFTIDLTAPEIAVTGVAGGGLYKAPVTPVVTVTGATAQTITLNGSPYVSGTPVTAEGAYTLVATASDAAGNTTTVTVAFAIDLTAPAITVTGATADGVDMAGSLAGGFTLPTTNVSSIDHLLQLKAGSVTSEPLAGAYTGCTWRPRPDRPPRSRPTTRRAACRASRSTSSASSTTPPPAPSPSSTSRPQAPRSPSSTRPSTTCSGPTRP